MFNKDHGTPMNENLYGTHPFYMNLDWAGKAHGVFFLNSNAQQATIDAPSHTLTWTSIGGIFDVFFFIGDSPKMVLKQYLDVIGHPMLPPYWALGYHQSRWGYTTLSETKQVVSTFARNNIPLDTIWNDIDFMDSYKDFTVDESRFPLLEFQNFLSDLSDTDQHYIQILDPGIKNESGYVPFDTGVMQGAFIKTSDGKNIIDKVWPGACVYPDMWYRDGQYWASEVRAWMGKLPLSGIWIDMNEPSGFCKGDMSGCYSSNRNSGPEDPPFVPGGGSLDDHTIRMDSVRNSDGETSYNWHSMYGFKESEVVYGVLKDFYPTKRPMIITRSSFAGSGRWVGHWLGDNSAAWRDLWASISGCLDMSLFGISLCGADICGFAGNTTEELCARWMQLGSFYTFMRNHNNLQSRSQEPYALGPVVLEVSKKMLAVRYVLLPYMYTQMLLAHRDAEAVMRPVFFEFPPKGWSPIPFLDHQFMLGPALLISPVLTQGHVHLDMFVPDAKFYDYYSGAYLSFCKRNQMCYNVDAPLEKINVHVRGGSIVPRQSKAGLTTAASRRNPLALLVALDDSGSATGYVYVDDGETIGNLESGEYSSMNFMAGVQSGSEVIVGTVEKAGFGGTKDVNVAVSDVVIFGVLGSNVTTVMIDGQLHTSFQFDTSLRVLTISGISGLSILKNFKIVYQ